MKRRANKMKKALKEEKTVIAVLKIRKRKYGVSYKLICKERKLVIKGTTLLKEYGPWENKDYKMFCDDLISYFRYNAMVPLGIGELHVIRDA